MNLIVEEEPISDADENISEEKKTPLTRKSL